MEQAAGRDPLLQFFGAPEWVNQQLSSSRHLSGS